MTTTSMTETSTETSKEVLLDARRLLCPLPVIRLQQTIRGLNNGDRVKMISTDRGVLHDVPAWCRIHGHTIVKSESLLKGEIEIEVLVQNK